MHFLFYFMPLDLFSMSHKVPGSVFACSQGFPDESLRIASLSLTQRRKGDAVWAEETDL